MHYIHYTICSFLTKSVHVSFVMSICCIYIGNTWIELKLIKLNWIELNWIVYPFPATPCVDNSTDCDFLVGELHVCNNRATALHIGCALSCGYCGEYNSISSLGPRRLYHSLSRHTYCTVVIRWHDMTRISGLRYVVHASRHIRLV
jgi:hypothetical protein